MFASTSVKREHLTRQQHIYLTHTLLFASPVMLTQQKSIRPAQKLSHTEHERTRTVYKIPNNKN